MRNISLHHKKAWEWISDKGKLQTSQKYRFSVFSVFQGFLKVHPSLTALITHHSIMPELLPVPLNIHRHNPSFSDMDHDYASLQDYTQLMRDLRLVEETDIHWNKVTSSRDIYRDIKWSNGTRVEHKPLVMIMPPNSSWGTSDCGRRLTTSETKWDHPEKD